MSLLSSLSFSAPISLTVCEHAAERKRAIPCLASNKSLVRMRPAVGPASFSQISPPQREARQNYVHIHETRDQAPYVTMPEVSYWLTRLVERPLGGRSLTNLHSLGDGQLAPCSFYGDLYLSNGTHNAGNIKAHPH